MARKTTKKVAAVWQAAAPPKYKNQKVTVDGIQFDSRRESQRYIVLREAERNGVITDLQCHPSWELLPNQYYTVRKQLKTKVKEERRVLFLRTTYTADFSYMKNGEYVVEDVKISKSLIPKEFILKEKMMYYFHHIRIRRIYKPSEEI